MGGEEFGRLDAALLLVESLLRQAHFHGNHFTASEYEQGQQAIDEVRARLSDLAWELTWIPVESARVEEPA